MKIQTSNSPDIAALQNWFCRPAPTSPLPRRRWALAIIILLALLLGWPLAGNAADGPAPASQQRQVLSDLHTDAVSIFAESNTITLGTKADIGGNLGVRLNPNLTLFNVEEAARIPVPASPAFAFLGTAGSDVWIAPEAQEPGVIWPGFSTEGVPVGVLDGDQLTIRLDAVTGPGTLHVFQSDVFGDPIRLFSSTGTNFREWTLSRGTHAHANWAFSAAGNYTLTFIASALTNGVSISATQNYVFVVGNVPATVGTTTTLAASTNNSIQGSAVSLTSTVAPTNAVGWVEFRDGDNVLGHDAVNAGSAGLTTTNLLLGARSVTARFVPQWLNDFSASTSAPVAITVTEPSGVPFAVAGVAASYLPGDTLTAQVVGHTLQSGQKYRWQWRVNGSTEFELGDVTTSPVFTRDLSASDNGYELSVSVWFCETWDEYCSDGTIVAQSPWVPVSVLNLGDPIVATLLSPTNAHLGDEALIAVSGRTLDEGETLQVVRRDPATGWHTWSSDELFAHQTNTVRIYLLVGGEFAVRVLDTNGLAIAQSAPMAIKVEEYEVQIAGVHGLYRPGATLQAQGIIHPESTNLFYQWSMFVPGGTNYGILKEGYAPGSDTLTISNLSLADNAGVLFLSVFVPIGPPFVEEEGLASAGQINVRVYVQDIDPGQQIFQFQPLPDHYHQGNTINLVLGVDPLPALGDQIVWEWRWPGGDWATFPGATGTSHSLVAEQALDGLQARASLVFADTNVATIGAGPVTIFVDDHGAAARQQPTLAGVTSYTAGQQATLTRQLPANGPTILTTHRWERKAAGAPEFTVISNVTSTQLTFPATMPDDGAQYRVSILKPDGTVAYGPSPAVTLDVVPPALVPFTMPNFVDTNSTSASAPQLADLNRDGNIDLAISGAQGVGYLLGAGAGSFLPAQFIPGGSGSRSDLVAVDFDGDGDIDLLNTQANAGDTADILCLYRNDGSANFTRVELIPALPRLSSQIEAADLNGDGRPDVIFGKGNTGVAYALQQVSGTLGAEVILPVTTTTASVQVADLDADGDPDIVVGNRTGSNGGAIFVFKNNGSGTFTAAPSISTGNFPSVLKLADMDGDGRVDILSTQLIANTRIGWYPQLPDGTFGPRVNVMTAVGQLNSLEVADINEDGVPDIVAGVTLLVNGNLTFVSVWSAGQGGGVYGNPILLDPTQGNNTGMLVADLDGDSHPDIIATGNSDSSRPSAVRVLINKVGEDPMVLLTPAARIRVAGDPIDLEIYFGFPVTVTGMPRVALQVGPNTVFATYLSGSGTGKLLFRYLATATDLDLDGVQLASNTIDLNGGTILDPLNGSAALIFPNLAFNGVIVNGAGPLVQNVTRLDPTPTTASSVRFQVQFAETVTGVDVADFELKQDAGDLADGSVLSVTGSGSTYEVSVATGTGSGTLGLSVKNAATIADLVGDPLAKGYVGGQVYTLKRGVPATISAIYRENHADYRPIWNNGEITFALDADPGTLGPVATLLPSDKVLTHAGPASIVARAAASTYDFIGVPAGSNVYVLPSSQIAGLPFLGISGESVPSGTFARYSPSTLLGDSRITSTNAYMRFQLVAMRSSSGGHMSIYTISSGNPRVWMATSDGINSMDAVYETPGGHSHRNVAFTKPGTYEVDVFVSGYRDANANTTYDPVTDPYIESGIFTMVFDVDTLGRTALSLASGNATLTLPTHNGLVYQLETAPAATGPWDDLGEPINGTGQTVDVVVPLNGPAGFFRWRIIGNP